MRLKMPWDFVGASCWGIDTEYFFPEKNILTDENRQAKKICASCIVKQDCLTYALHYQVQGIWSGTTPKERSRMRIKLNIIPKPITNERHKL
jgi:WhiB family redox-sensing transcriptional regulator